MSKPDGNVHVMPTDAEHEESKDCWCSPTLQEDYTAQGGKKVYLHREMQ